MFSSDWVFLYKKGDKISQFTSFLSHRLACVWHTGWRRFVLGSTFFYIYLNISWTETVYRKVFMKHNAHSYQFPEKYHFILCYCSGSWLVSLLTDRYLLHPGVAAFFCKRQDSKCFQLCLLCGSSSFQSQAICDSAAVFCRTLFTEIGGSLDMGCWACSLLTSMNCCRWFPWRNHSQTLFSFFSMALCLCKGSVVYRVSGELLFLFSVLFLS